MLFFISQMGLKQWARSGHTGHSRWSDFVGSFYVASRAAATHLLILILTSRWLDSLIRFETGTMLMTNLPSFLQRVQTLVNLHLPNVRTLMHVQIELSRSSQLTDPTSVLCFPRQKTPTIPDSLRLKIIATLTTRYNTTHTIIKRHFRVQEVEFWGKFRRLGGGDTMRAAAICQSNAEDRRDASYVRV